MFKKINNRTLLILFGILALIAAAVYFYDSKKGDRSFRKELLTIDSASISSVTIYKKGSTTEFIKLVKSGTGWMIRSKDKQYPADTNAIRSILQVLSHINPERVAASGKDGWKGFDMTDSASTRVVVEQGSEVTADFRLGKLSFSQNRQRQGYGGYGMEVKSHIRVPDDDRVYVVDGYLSMMFSSDPSGYRNRLVSKFERGSVSRFSFVYPGDSSFVLSREGTGWLLNGQPADSALTEQWVSSLAYLTNQEFGDNENLPFNMPFNLRIEGNKMQPIDLKGAMDTVSNKYFLTTSVNPSAVFSGNLPGLYGQVFPAKSKFLPTGKTEKKKK